MKIVDFDKMFEEYTQKFLEKNGSKYTVEQIENVQPMLYKKFSQLSIKALDGKTPENYFDGLGDTLIEVLKKYIREGVSINDFLVDKMVQDVSESALIQCLNPEFDCEYLNIICEILQRKNSENCQKAFVKLFLDERTPVETVNFLIDVLSEQADLVAKLLLNGVVTDSKKLQVAEIISCCKIRTSSVTEFLRNQLIENSDKLVELLSFVVKYNDESMLDLLYELINDENIGYIEFKELKLTIEALGGNCDLQRDFSEDKYYKKIIGLE